MVLDHHRTNKTARVLYNSTHLQALTYPGDSKLNEFMEDWYRIEDDLDESLSELQLEHIFYEKIARSQVLKPWLEKYRMLDDSDPEHCYSYLIDAVIRYQLKSQADGNMSGLLKNNAEKPEPGSKAEKRKLKAALAAAFKASLSQQCRFHLSPTGCWYPDTCTNGRHDPEFKGKGFSSKGTGGKGTDPKGKGKKGDPKGGGKGDGKSAAAKAKAKAKAQQQQLAATDGGGGADGGAAGGQGAKGGGRGAKGDPKGKGRGQPQGGGSQNGSQNGSAPNSPRTVAKAKAAAKAKAKAKAAAAAKKDT